MNTEYLKDISDFYVVGINYKKSDACVRGQFAIGNEQYLKILQKATEQGLNEVFILSTCNRTEIYGFAFCSHQLTDLLCSETMGSAETFIQSAYTKQSFRSNMVLSALSQKD
jgi:glutamyl-tRNA reductase